MLKACGCIFLAKSTGRILLNCRSNTVSKPNLWGFWGGKLNSDEKIFEGLSREVSEEVGFIPHSLKNMILDQYTSPDEQFQYTSFVVFVENEFIPITNRESSGFCWCSFYCYPKPLHPGAKTILYNRVTISSINKMLQKLK